MFIIIRETKHPVTGARWFKALPEIIADETMAAFQAAAVAKYKK